LVLTGPGEEISFFEGQGAEEFAGGAALAAAAATIVLVRLIHIAILHFHTRIAPR